VVSHPWERIASQVGPRILSRSATGSEIFALVADVTQILNAIEASDPRAAEELLPLVYDELRKLAARLAKVIDFGVVFDAERLVAAQAVDGTAGCERRRPRDGSRGTAELSDLPELESPTEDVGVDQEGRGRSTGSHHEQLERSRTHRFVPGDAASIPFLPFDSVQSR